MAIFSHRSCWAFLHYALLSLPLFGWTLGAGAGVIYDAEADFNLAENSETSRWSYRTSDDLIRDGDYQLIADTGLVMRADDPTQPGTQDLTTEILGWREQLFWGTAKNQFGADLQTITVAPFTWPEDALLVHPGAGAFAVVTWLAPSAGILDLTYTVTDLDSNGGDGIDFFIDLGLTELASQLSVFNTTRTGSLNNISVLEGDRIHFIVSPRTTGNHEFDSTRLQAAINFAAVPEPASIALWGLGTLGVGVMVRRRKRTQLVT